MILDRNLFVERVLPASILRRLDPAEMDEYRRPFAGAREDRWPTLAWPREIPIDGEPQDVVALVASYAEWMAGNDVPKLFVNAEPGAILTGAPREFCRAWHNQTEVTVRGSHFIQEDSGPEIGRAIAMGCRAGERLKIEASPKRSESSARSSCMSMISRCATARTAPFSIWRGPGS